MKRHVRNARVGTGNARVHLFERRVYLRARACTHDVAPKAKLKELAYGI
jgi:hypothetical protein